MLTKSLLRALLAAAMSFFAPPLPAAEVPVPLLKARVTDLTSTLSQTQHRVLEQKLAAFEARKGSQVAVLIVPTTQPETIEQYSIRVAEQWKLGRKGVDDGVLLLVAKNDRKLRIEVGYGLEGDIPDAVAKRIASDVIAPRFKRGDFFDGISAGLDRIIGTIEGKPQLRPPARKQTSPFQPSAIPSTPDSGRHAVTGFFAGIVLGILLGAAVSLVLGGLGAATVASGATILIVSMDFDAPWAGTFAGVIVFFLILSLAGNRRWRYGSDALAHSGRGSVSSSDRGELAGGSGSFGGAFARSTGSVRTTSRCTTSEDVMASRAKVAGIAGLVAGILVWIPTGSIGLGIAVGLIASVLVFVALMSQREGGGGFWDGGGGDSDSGGFFGGGGLFGGGGASGDWGD